MTCVRLRFRCWTGQFAQTRLPGEATPLVQSVPSLLHSHLHSHLPGEATPFVQSVALRGQQWLPSPPLDDLWRSGGGAPTDGQRAGGSLNVDVADLVAVDHPWPVALPSSPRRRMTPPRNLAVAAPDSSSVGEAPAPSACLVSVVGHGPVVGRRDTRAHVLYAIRIRAVTGSWQVWRRFSQFAELDHELKAKGHGEALQHVRASLPSKLRLPLGLQIEGDERQPTLDAYLERLMAHQRLRHSDQLMFFVSQTEVHRRLWRRAMGMAAPEDAEQQLIWCE